MGGWKGAKTGSIFLIGIIYIHIILRLYSTCFCTIGANDKCVYWFVEQFKARLIFNKIRDKCLIGCW